MATSKVGSLYEHIDRSRLHDTKTCIIKRSCMWPVNELLHAGTRVVYTGLLEKLSASPPTVLTPSRIHSTSTSQAQPQQLSSLQSSTILTSPNLAIIYQVISDTTPVLVLATHRQTTMSSADKSQIKNANSAAKDAGFDNFPAFLLSYGLRIYNLDDVEEGKAILRGMGYGV